MGKFVAAPFCYYCYRAQGSPWCLKLSARCVKFTSNKLISPAGGALGGREAFSQALSSGGSTHTTEGRQEGRISDLTPSCHVLELVQSTCTKSEATAGTLTLLTWKHCCAGFDWKFCLGEDLVSILSPFTPLGLPRGGCFGNSLCCYLCHSESGSSFAPLRRGRSLERSRRGFTETFPQALSPYSTSCLHQRNSSASLT